MSDLQIFEKNGLYLIVSPSNLQKVLNNYVKELIEDMQNMQYKDYAFALQKANKSINNIQLQVDKALKMIEFICKNGQTIIDMPPKTKAGKFNRVGKTWLYRIDIVLNFDEGNCMSLPDKLALTLGKNDTYTDISAWIPKKAVTDSDYALLEQQFGKDFEKSGKFLFLRVDRFASVNKTTNEFLFDANGNLNQKGVEIATKKKTAVTEFKTGCLYSNKNGKEYLCIPDFDYMKIVYYCRDNVKQVCGDSEEIITQTHIDYINNKFKTVFSKEYDKAVDQSEFKEVYERATAKNQSRTCTEKPIFIEYNATTRKRFNIDACKTAEEVTYNYIQVAAKAKSIHTYDPDPYKKGLASKTKIKGMLEELKTVLPSVTCKDAFEFDTEGYKEYLPYVKERRYFKISKVQTIEKKDLI